MTTTTNTPTEVHTETIGSQTLEGEVVDRLRVCIRELEQIGVPQRKRVADYLYAWTREPDRSKALE